MQLDEFQLAEFDNHWRDCWALYGGRPCYIRGPADGGRFQVHILRPDNEYDAANILPHEVEPWHVRTGYYNFHYTQRANYSNASPRKTLEVFSVTRSPTQHHKRGLSSRNTLVFRAHVTSGVYESDGNNLFSHVSWPLLHYGGVHPTPEMVESLVNDRCTPYNGLALTPDVALLKDRDTKVPIVVVRGVPVGYAHKRQIYLNKGTSSFLQLVQKQTFLPVTVR